MNTIKSDNKTNQQQTKINKKKENQQRTAKKL